MCAQTELLTRLATASDLHAHSQEEYKDTSTVLDRLLPAIDWLDKQPGGLLDPLPEKPSQPPARFIAGTRRKDSSAGRNAAVRSQQVRHRIAAQ